ncbi:MAG: hypothetical protein V1847_02075 [Candidatus Diapherotrites archaeon]
MKAVFVLLSLALMASLAFAFDCPSVTLNGIPIEQASLRLPSAVGRFFEGETTNLHVLLDNGETVIVGGKVQKELLNELTCGGFSSPSLNAFLDQATLESIDSSPNPVKTFLDAQNSGKFRLEGNGFVSELKVAIANFFASIASWFS